MSGDRDGSLFCPGKTGRSAQETEQLPHVPAPRQRRPVRVRQRSSESLGGGPSCRPVCIRCCGQATPFLQAVTVTRATDTRLPAQPARHGAGAATVTTTPLPPQDTKGRVSEQGDPGPRKSLAKSQLPYNSALGSNADASNLRAV